MISYEVVEHGKPLQRALRDTPKPTGAGAPPAADGARRIDARGHLATPGLVNCHDHLSQWATRGLAQDEGLFGGSRPSTPAGRKGARRGGGPRELLSAQRQRWPARAARRAPDHPDPSLSVVASAAAIRAAQEIGLRFHPCRGSITSAVRTADCPRMRSWRTATPSSAATEEAIDRWHDPLARLDAARRGRPVLSVLGHARPARRFRRARPAARRAAAHPPGRDR